MKLTDNALIVLGKRYFKRDNAGIVIEDWPSMLKRVANDISDGDPEKSKRYYELMDSGYFLPNSPTLMNAGSDLQQLSACFVLPIEDSMDSIFETIKNAALIHKSGGGTGFSFSNLREANAQVRSTNGVSSGPISFLKVYNAATDAVKQGGTRRGANMAVLRVNHPQILEFVTCKENINELTNFNISVALDDEFMNAVYTDGDFELVSPYDGQVKEVVKARVIFDLIIEMAHRNGEPGVIYIDRINQANPTPHLGAIESTNPCGEQPLLPYEACNLGSINLSVLALENDVNWTLLRQVIRDSVDFLDDVIDRSKFPLARIDETAKGNRKIGLGIMGWADLLYYLSIPYASDEAISLAKQTMEFIDFEAKLRSVELARDRGSYPNFVSYHHSDALLGKHEKNPNWGSLIDGFAEYGIRNATVTTIAPTGTISMIADTSSGIEPQFSLVYVKKVMDGENLLYVNKYFAAALDKIGLNDHELLSEVAAYGSIQHIDRIPKDIKRVFQTAHDISPEWHIRIQAAFQEFTDNAVSKTINFHRNATVNDVRTAFEMAYQLGCKGITVYRDGSRENQVLNIGTSSIGKPAPDTKIMPRTRPTVTHGITQKMETGCGHMYVTVNSDDFGACEIFVQMGKVGGCASAQLEAIARLASLSLRSFVNIESIIKQLKGIRCQSPMWYKGKMITSCGDALAQALENFLLNHLNPNSGALVSFKFAEEPINNENKRPFQSQCPECGSSLEHLEGCLKCPQCGWTKC